ncbi:Surface antigen [Cyclobacterium xiamenense]|uniref:Surface antigen n=1 Tax=Cyclobacterium xiamenense TaxID=1297121 RepID=A0A1H6YLZ6_9BACT|nr:BamA/TamA family outer membrane protein [Cyclobacterium xiamenense]SEJ40854.1 Surface antigen [Cyclobacterium xiamenense]
MTYRPFIFFQFLIFCAASCLLSLSLPAQQIPAEDPSGQINPPERVTVNNIFVVGNEKTRRNIILREMDIETGVTYDWEAFVELLLADEKKIYNLQLFTTATLTPLFVADEQVELLVSLKERWYILPSLIFNLADRNFSEWWINQGRDFSRVNYGVKLDHNNVGGRNEKLRVIGQLGFTQAVDLNYSIPYLDKNQLHGLAAKFNYFTNKNIPIRSIENKQFFYRNEAEDVLRKTLNAFLTYSFRGSFYNIHYLTAGFHNTRIHADVLEQNPNYFTHGSQRLKYFMATYRYRHDNRDNVAYATEGTLLDLSLTQYGLFSGDDISETEFSVLASTYTRLGKKFHFATGISGSAFFSPRQPYTLVRGIGYRPDFIRGYEVNVIEGQQTIVHKNSLRYELLNIAFDISDFMPIEEFSVIPFQLYLSANFDQGFVRDANRIPENARLTNRYLSGYGFGLDLIGIYDTVFRFEYSFNNAGTGNFFINVRAPL